MITISDAAQKNSKNWKFMTGIVYNLHITAYEIKVDALKTITGINENKCVLYLQTDDKRLDGTYQVIRQTSANFMRAIAPFLDTYPQGKSISVKLRIERMGEGIKTKYKIEKVEEENNDRS